MLGMSMSQQALQLPQELPCLYAGQWKSDLSHPTLDVVILGYGLLGRLSPVPTKLALKRTLMFGLSLFCAVHALTKCLSLVGSQNLMWDREFAMLLMAVR